MRPLYFATIVALFAWTPVAACETNDQCPLTSSCQAGVCIGQIQQPLVRGTLAPLPLQRELGLLTLTNPEGTCSASMLNDYWAITAAHCVFSPTTFAQFAPNQITLNATWATRPATVRQIVAYSAPTAFAPSDVALLQVGLNDLNRPGIKAKLYIEGAIGNERFRGYGRGVNILAFQSGPTATPSSSDGQYRFGDFDVRPRTSNQAIYSFAPGIGGAIGAAGDSGGPSYIQEWDNPNSTRRQLEWQLVGVHSRCVPVCLPGQSCAGPNPFRWAAAISSCEDAAIFPIRDSILQVIDETPPMEGPTGQFPPVPDEVVSHPRAIYAISIDEPLIAPTNAAIDVQLTFGVCHSPVRVTQGCPLSPEYQLWSYDPNSHRLVHAASRKCLNISGARFDPGSPIILFPCVGAANEKWTLVERSGVMTITSDMTGMCLEAEPGRPPSSGGVFATLGTPATLVQKPCNNSTAQSYRDADADWSRRNGPR